MGFGIPHLHTAIHTYPAVRTTQGQHSQPGVGIEAQGCRSPGRGDGLSVPPNTHQQPVLSLGSHSLPCRSRVSLLNMVRVKYLSGCLKENQAGGWAGGENVHKHGQEVAHPWLPLGQWPWPCSAPSWLPGNPWKLQAGPHVPQSWCAAGGIRALRAAAGRQQHGPSEQGHRDLELWAETGASRCLEAAPRAGVNGESWELSGWSGFTLAPCCSHSQENGAPKPGGRQGGDQAGEEPSGDRGC